MPTIAEYEAWKANQQQANVGKANIVLGQPFVAEPDQVAADLNLTREASSALGRPVPSSMMSDPASKSVFEQIVAEKKRSTILSSSPRLTEWLRIPENAALARDDLEGLSWWETVSRATGNAVIERGGLKLGQGYNQWMAEGAAQRSGDQAKSFGDIYAEERANVGPIGNVIDNAVGPVTDLWNAGSRVLQAKLSDAFGGDQKQAAAYYQQQVGLIGQQIAETPMSPGAEKVRSLIGTLQPSGDLGTDFANFIDVIAQDPAGFTAFLAETAAETAPSLAAAFAVGATTRNPAAFAATMGVSSGLQERYLAPAEMMADRGIDISTPEGAMAAISDPDLMRDAASRGEIRGLVIGALDTISGGVAGETLSSNHLANVVLQSVLQAAFGSAGEAGAQIASGQTFNLAEVLIEGLAEFVTAPIEVGGMAASRVREGMSKSEASINTTASLQEMAANATNSPVRNRMPDVFRDYIAKVTANGPRESMFVPAEKFSEYFQSQGLDPFELVDALNGLSRADLQTAIDTGGSVKIPTATWAADMAGGPHDQFIIENSAFSPDEMTAFEAAEFNSQVQQLQNEAWLQAEAIRLDDEQTRAVYEIEREELVGYLRAAGRAVDVATAEALPMVAFRRTMAERMELTPEEFAARYPLPKAEGQRPEGLDPKNVDALTRTLAEARARRKVEPNRGPTLLEFISERGGITDPGGELKARDAAVIKRGRGKKTLKLERGGLRAAGDLLGLTGSETHGFDDVARAAIEAGYMAGDPLVLEYQEAQRGGTEAPEIGRALLAAIDRELAGQAEYSGTVEQSVAAEQTDGLDSVEEYLAGLGLSLDDTDADIRTALDRDGLQYGQASRLGAALRSLIDFARGGPKNETQTVEIGQVTDEAAQVIQDTTGLDVSGFTHTVDAFALRHMLKNHGDEKAERARGQLPLTDADLLAIPAMLANATHIVTGIKGRRGQEIIGYIAPTADGSVAYVEEAREGRKRLAALSMRKFPPATKSESIAAGLDPNARNVPGGSINITALRGGATYNQADAGFGFGGGSRGSIQFPASGIANGDTLISLFQKADLSTFLHETGHYFLTVTKDAAGLDPTGPLAGEFAVVKDWWRQNAADVAADAGNGVTADDVRTALDLGTTGDIAKDTAIDVGMQEQFARAIEQYFMEGKAPSPSLRQAFEKFRAWLTSIYRNLRGLNVQVTDELRGVFDRMMATDDEIASARTDIGADVALTAADLGMTDEQFAGFLKLRDQAKADASAKLLRETMAPIRRAREQWFKDERAKVREDVERNTNAQPVYRAIEWMGNRRWLGDDAPAEMPDIRFSKDVLVDRYGEGVLATLPRGKFTVYSVEGGLNPDDAAGWFGFSSGDAMIQAMERAPNRKEFIEAEADKVMRERHGDVLRDGTVEQQAMEAVHTDSRARELATELQAMNEIAGTDRGLTAKDAREMARRTVGKMRTRDALNSGRFLAAERKAAGEVARLASTVTREGMWMDRARRRVETQARAAVREGDGAAALTLPVEKANQNTQRFNEQAAALVEAKRRQLLNHALYSEALAVAGEVGKAERLVDRLTKAVQRRRSQDGKQTIAHDSLDAIAELIERYDFRKMSGPAEQRRGALNRYLESMVEQGRENELAIPRHVLADAAKVPYRTLSVGDLRGVIDTLKNLESTGRRWQKLLIAKKTREMDEAVGSIVTALTDNVGLKPADWVSIGWQKSAKGALNQYLSTFTTAATVIRQMDGRADLGPVYELLKSDIDKAAYDERDMRTAAAEKIEALYSVYSGDEQRKMAVLKSVPELGGKSFSKWNLMSMALNMGNEGNLHRLTNKKARQHLTPAQVEAVKGLLDKRDWDFVQSIWDYLDTFRPQIAERQKRVTGVEPDWVEASAVETPHGTYRGGYYPIKYATEQGGASTPSLSGETDIIQSMRLGSYSKAATKSGHLETRVANVQQSLLLDVGVIATHTNEVIHDLTFSEPVVNTWRLLNDQRVSSAMLDAGMQEQHEALKLWLKDTAVGQVFASDFMSRTVRNLRSGFTVSRLSWNVGTAMLQPTGLLQSAVVVGKRQLANSIIQYTRNPKAMIDDVLAKSRVMGERQNTFQKDLMDMVAETNISSPSASALKGPMDMLFVKGGMAMMMYTQFYVVDVPTWAAAYDKGMRQFDGNQVKASEYADMTINRAQGSGLWSDRSNIERGTLSATTRQNSFVTLFTTLGSYFFAKMNLMIERTQALRAEPISMATAASYAFDVGLLLAGEAAVTMLAHAGTGMLFGDDDDGDDEENPAMNLGVEAAKVFAAGLPGIRDAVSVYQGFSGGTYAGVMDILVKPAKEVAQGEFDRGLVKSWVNLAGVAARLPAAQANRIIDAGWRDIDGDDVAAMEYLFGRKR